jgi:ubiquinone/menaquinone biosynthesis C-methylase UbiE
MLVTISDPPTRPSIKTVPIEQLPTLILGKRQFQRRKMVRIEGTLKEKVESAFDGFSSAYDKRVGDIMKFTTNRILGDIKVPDNPVCLDLACGTGISTFEVVKHCGGHGKFYALDISQEMLDKAVQRASEEGIDCVTFVRGGAEALEFPDSTFDLVLCNMSFQFFPDKPKALGEIHRVLKPRGRVALVFMGGPSFQESFRITLELAERHPEYPGFKRVIEETQEMMIDLESMDGYLDSAGFVDAWMYGRHAISYIDPDALLADEHPNWGMHKTALPQNAQKPMQEELRAAYRNAAAERGLKTTFYIVFSSAKKAL